MKYIKKKNRFGNFLNLFILYNYVNDKCYLYDKIVYMVVILNENVSK